MIDDRDTARWLNANTPDNQQAWSPSLIRRYRGTGPVRPVLGRTGIAPRSNVNVGTVLAGLTAIGLVGAAAYTTYCLATDR